MKKLFKIALISILILFICAATFVSTLFLGGFGKIPNNEELKNLKAETATLVYSSDGKMIGKFFHENRTNVPYDSLPKHLIDALIATEDARFYEHKGVDGIALMRVLFKSILLGNRSAGGGSTLSQQLAKNLFGRKDYGKISIGVNKLKEIILANRLENLYTKAEILTLYLNTVPFGENVFGIEVAAHRYFSKNVSQLKIEEAAVLVGLLKANTKYNPRLYPKNALARRNVVLKQMFSYQYLTNHDKDSLSELELKLNYTNLSKNNQVNYFLTEVKKELKSILEQIQLKNGTHYDIERDGLKIETSLNNTLQQSAIKAFELHLSKMQGYLDQLYNKGYSKKQLKQLANKVAKRQKINTSRLTKSKWLFSWDKNSDTTNKTISVEDSLMHTLRQLHAGLIALNPKDGAVLSWLGGINFQLYPFDQVLAKRQMASTFKPILYANALANGRIPCDYLSNSEIELKDYENWSPSNYDGESGGNYSLAASLAYSKNLPTVHLYFETEVQQLEELWNKLGFIEKLNDDPSVILGTNSASLKEIAIAYSVFANGGYLIEPYCIDKIYSDKGELIFERKANNNTYVLPKDVTDGINSILVKAINEGTGKSIRSQYNLTIPFAGKTGTSQNYSDAWFVGYNENILLASRVGASYPSIHFKSGKYGSGSTLALPLVALALKEALTDLEFKQLINEGAFHNLMSIECEDFREDKLIDKVFNIFKKEETTLEDERKRSKKKKKVKKFLKNVFGDN